MYKVNIIYSDKDINDIFIDLLNNYICKNNNSDVSYKYVYLFHDEGVYDDK